MCVDPMTALSIGGSALGATGSIMGGDANAKSAEIAAQTAEANSKMALAEGEGRVSQINQRVNNAIGGARATFAAGNLALNSGSPLAVQAMSAQQGNTDKQLALAGSLNQASGQNFQAAQDLTAAGQDRMSGILGAGVAMMRGLGGIKGLGGSMTGGGGGGFGNFANLAGSGSWMGDWSIG